MSLDGGRTIYGFGPVVPEGKDLLEDIVPLLKEHVSFTGQVRICVFILEMRVCIRVCVGVTCMRLLMCMCVCTCTFLLIKMSGR